MPFQEGKKKKKERKARDRHIILYENAKNICSNLNFGLYVLRRTPEIHVEFLLEFISSIIFPYEILIHQLPPKLSNT